MSDARRARHASSPRHFMQGVTKGPGLGRFRPILPLMIGTSVLGAGAAESLHILALIDPTGMPGLLAFLLLPGVVLVFLPVILESHRLGMASRDPTELFPMRTDWSQVMRGVPRSIRAIAWTMLAFTLLGAVWLMVRGASSGVAGASVTAPVIAVFVYGSSALVLISAYCIPPDAPSQPTAPPEHDQV